MTIWILYFGRNDQQYQPKLKAVVFRKNFIELPHYLWWNNALWLVKNIHVTKNSQSECHFAAAGWSRECSLWKGNFHCTTDLLFDWIGFNQTSSFNMSRAAESQQVKKEVSCTMNDTSLTKRVFSGSSGYYGDKKSRLNLGQNEF